MYVLAVKIPTKLGTKNYFKPSSKQYCAIGYLSHHLLGTSRKYLALFDCDRGGLLSKIGVTLDDLVRLVKSNDSAPTQKARLIVFRDYCKKWGITIIERTTKTEGE